MIAADGANSQTRAAFAGTFQPSLEARRCKYIWLGTDLVFDAFKFYMLDTPCGNHAGPRLPLQPGCEHLHPRAARRRVAPRRVRRAARRGPLPPGHSDEASIELIGELCAEVLGGHKIVGNNSQWVNFTTVRCATWRRQNIVLLGDAAHTAHFSIGSGTKLAMEDALALAACLHEQPGVPAALTAYEAERRPVVASTQRAAQASLEWFENIGQYTDQDPPQFAFNIITRSRRVTYDNLRLRDPEFVAAMDAWFAGAQQRSGGGRVRPPMFQPGRIGRLELANRVIVSPMDMYCASDGVPGDFHLVHLGSKALGGAGLVMTEMVCVSPSGRHHARAAPGCTRRSRRPPGGGSSTSCTRRTSAKIGIQLGHSGRKGSTRLMWEGMDEPLPRATGRYAARRRCRTHRRARCRAS